MTVITKTPISTTTILLKNNLVSLPKIENNGNNLPSSKVIGTVFANLAYYGYFFSKEAVTHFLKLNDSQIIEFWPSLESSLKSIVGDDKNMSNYVVYKNFPQEVLDMSTSEYWIKQILMYVGLPNNLFTQTETLREKLDDNIKLKVLHLSNDNSLSVILSELLSLPSKWIEDQLKFVNHLVFNEKLVFDLQIISFKENLISLVKELINNNVLVNLRSATDVLRLGVSLSDGDISLRLPTKFRNFTRPERKYILGLLESSSNLEEDMARYKNTWKRFMKNLHVGDYKLVFPKTILAYNALYNDKVQSFNGKVEVNLLNKDNEALKLLSTRQGDFLRRINKLFSVFGSDTLKYLVPVLPKLKVIQLIKLKNSKLSIVNS